MDPLILVVFWYLVGAALLGAVLLFGQQSSRASCMGRLYYFMAQGPCDAAMWCVSCVCGEAGVRRVDAANEYLCDKPNPALQILYSLLLGGGYYLYSLYVFPLLPGPFVSDIHVHTGTATLLLCFTLLAICSVSDPGIVTERNGSRLCRAYSYDEPLRPESLKHCSTCDLRRPQRTKHCSTCDRCIARFDHHCGWINNCVGYNNLRLFVFFLAANTFLCVYAVVVAVFAIWGDMERRGTFRATIINYQTGQPTHLGRDWRYVTRFVLRHFHIAVTLNIFLICMAIMLAGFLGYHLWLIAINSTTYERIKLDRARKRRRAESRADPIERKAEHKGAKIEEEERSFSRGVAANFAECLMPEWFISRSDREKRE